MNNVSSGISPVSTDLSHCIEQLKAVLKHLRHDVLASPYRALCDRIESRLEEIEREASREVECALTLLGESGAGKSTLINALIGADLLPHDGVQAVTAAVCEVSRGDQGYVIQTTLRDRQASNEMLDRLWRCVQQAANDRGEERASESQLEIDASHRRMLKSITGKSPEECVSAGCGSLDSLLLDPVRQALSGVRERLYEFDRSASQEAKACIRDHVATDSPMWPFVERLSIGGPFGSIPRGVRIVDIPGLNDPDEAREMVARKYLATANSIWLVLSYKRAFTREVVDYLHVTGVR
jgi:energy-coupling factor transporter ATP-binding protein EcfA2